MKRTFDVIHPDVPLEQAAARVDPTGRRPILVCEDDRLIGVLDTEALHAGRRMSATGARSPRVRDAVAPDVLYCLESTDLEEAAALMREHQALAIPVLSAERRLVGVVALEDVPESAATASPTAARPRDV